MSFPGVWQPKMRAQANVPLPQKPGYQYPDYDMQSLGPYQNTGGPSPYNTGYRQDWRRVARFCALSWVYLSDILKVRV